MAFSQQINPMDYAKKAGRESRIADVVQNLKVQQAELPGKMGEYGMKQTGLDMFSNLVSSYGIDALLALGTGGASTGFSLLKKLFGTGVVGKVGEEGFKAAIPATGLSKLLGMFTKGAGKYSLSDKISDVLGKQFKIKPPEAPTVDMSKLTGPGMSRARGTIADALEVSDVGYTGVTEDFKKNEKIMNLLMSFGEEFKEPLKEGGLSIMDIFRKQLGLSKQG